MMESVRTSERAVASHVGLKRVVALLSGALLVTLGAQIAVPLPGTTVPITLQVPAVLIVGGLLGPTLGATSLAVYLVMGIMGLPVFAAGGVLGIARLFGPTGGYLLAFPLAAALAGRVAPGGRSWMRLGVAVIAATLVIHAGGVAQLALLGGDLGIAVRAGSLPFLAGDVVKLVVAALVIRRFAPKIRRALH